jgi:hypothetical protein
VIGPFVEPEHFLGGVSVEIALPQQLAVWGLLTKEGTSNQAAAGLLADEKYGTPFLFQTLFLARQDLQHIAVAAVDAFTLGMPESFTLAVPRLP